MSETIQDRIARLMRERGHNMKSLSLAAGLGETAVRDIMMRTATIKWSTIEALARVLGVEPITLVSDKVNLSAEESELLSTLRTLPDEQRALLLSLGRQLAAAARAQGSEADRPA
jgi:transcriptional regulator with XRE-family HTH domain